MTSLTTVKPSSKGGRPRDPNKKVFHTIGLTPAQWDYVELYAIRKDEALNPTEALSELVDRIQRFSPGGPHSIGRKVSRPRHILPRWLTQYAIDKGLTRSEAAALIVARARPEGY